MIEVLKQAMEALEFDSLYGTGKQEAITSLRQAIAELESQEPVAWRLNGESSLGHGKVFGDWKSGNPPADVADLASVDKNWSLEFAHTTPSAQPAKPIPCANHCEATAFEIVIKNLQGEIERLKASRREWVGLTKEDKDLIEDLCKMMIGDAVFSTIDAILKGKNT